MIDYSIAIKSAKPGTKKVQITETKAYGQAQVRQNLGLELFAQHISEHNCAYDKGDIQAILAKAVRCLREEILNGNSVTLGDLGTFSPSISCKGAKTADSFTAENITAVNVTWRKSSDFKGKNLRAKAEFHLVPSRAAQASQVEVIKNQETIQGLE